MSDHDLLSVVEVAEYLRVSSRLVRELIQRGELKAKKLGKAYRIRKSDVENLLNETKA